MLQFLLGICATWIFIFIAMLVQKFLEQRETRVRLKLLNESLELMKKRNQELRAKNNETLAKMLQDPISRHIYDTLEHLVERLTKKQGATIEIPANISIDVSFQIIDALTTTLQRHIAENQAIQTFLDSESEKNV